MNDVIFSNISASDIEKGHDQFELVLSRSKTDAEFRSQLLEDPRAALEEVTGQSLPTGMDIRFIENAGSATIVLPDVEGGEIGDQELEMVAGGIPPLVIGIAGAFVFHVAKEAYNDWDAHKEAFNEGYNG